MLGISHLWLAWRLAAVSAFSGCFTSRSAKSQLGEFDVFDQSIAQPDARPNDEERDHVPVPRWTSSARCSSSVSFVLGHFGPFEFLVGRPGALDFGT
jgi:hypothetical protein